MRCNHDRNRCVCHRCCERLGFVEEPRLIGADLSRWGLLRGAPKQLALEPPVLLGE